MTFIIEMFKYLLLLLLTMEEALEKSVFMEYFGNYPLIKVLDFLILGRDMDYSLTEIAKNAGVGWTAFSELWPQLVEKQIVLFTRQVGNAKLFRLNIKNAWVKELIKMDNIITRLETEKVLSEDQKLAV